ncbi:MAG TPA: hypothetical protein VG269_16195 [Tepidisphaeraceae bacterium]|jgi:hypothetical protein|nr:hypothetical protein [Tepidisphaeraceae bacterium]
MPTYSVISADGQMYGPADEITLAQWAREGRISAQTPLHCHETNARLMPGMVPAIAPLVGLPVATTQQLLQPTPNIGTLAYGQSIVPQGMVGNELNTFSIPAVLVLHFVTSGLFTLIWFQLMHGKMPKNRPDDPSGGKAVGFMFIPIFSIYWIFFANLRLIDRINEQRHFAGLPPAELRGIFLTAIILLFVPCANLISALILIPIFLAGLQRAVNELCQATGRA